MDGPNVGTPLGDRNPVHARSTARQTAPARASNVDLPADQPPSTTNILGCSSRPPCAPVHRCDASDVTDRPPPCKTLVNSPRRGMRPGQAPAASCPENARRPRLWKPGARVARGTEPARTDQDEPRRPVGPGRLWADDLVGARRRCRSSAQAARRSRRKASPSSASASCVSASGRQIAAAVAIVSFSAVKDSMQIGRV